MAARHPRHLHGAGPRPAPTPATVREPGETAYADEPFVHLLPEGQWPRDGRRPRHQRRAAAGDASTSRLGRVVVVAAIDNLTKGTAGAAVQCANLALGLAGDRRPPVAGVAP